MTLATMQTLFWELIQESSSDTDFPAATVLSWLNIAIERAGMEALYYEKPVSLSTVSGTRTVALPADFIVMKDLDFTNTTTTEVAPVRFPIIQLDYVTTGRPEFYSIRNSTLYFDPIPNVTASSLSGFYIAKETALASGSDTPAMPAEFHAYMVHYAVYLSLLSDGQTQQALPHLEEYNEGVRRLANRFWDDRIRRNFNMFVKWAAPGAGGEK